MHDDELEPDIPVWQWRDREGRSERIDDVVVGKVAGKWRVYLHDATEVGRPWGMREAAKDWADKAIPMGSMTRCLEGPTVATRWEWVLPDLEAMHAPKPEAVVEPKAIQVLRRVEWGADGLSCPCCKRQRYPKRGAWHTHAANCELASLIGAKRGNLETPAADPASVQLALFALRG